MRILLAVDGSAVGATAVRRVAKLAKELATPPVLHVLTVVPRLSMPLMTRKCPTVVKSPGVR